MDSTSDHPAELGAGPEVRRDHAGQAAARLPQRDATIPVERRRSPRRSRSTTSSTCSTSPRAGGVADQPDRARHRLRRAGASRSTRALAELDLARCASSSRRCATSPAPRTQFGHASSRRFEQAAAEAAPVAEPAGRRCSAALDTTFTAWARSASRCRRRSRAGRPRSTRRRASCRPSGRSWRTARSCSVASGRRSRRWRRPRPTSPPRSAPGSPRCDARRRSTAA